MKVPLVGWRERWFFEKHAKGLQKALDHGQDARPLETVWSDIEKGDMQIWTGRKSSVMITQLLTHTGGAKECNIFLATGTLEEMEEMLPDVERFARANNATTMTVVGRKGWDRSFLTRTAGYTATAVIFGKDLTDE